MRLAMIMAWVLLTTIRSTAAQDDHWYVGGGVIWSTQDPTTPSGGSSIPSPGLGGSAAGFSIDVGRMLAPHAGVALEVSVPKRFEVFQATGIPSTQIDNQHRDVVFSGLFHIFAPKIGPLVVAFVAGPSSVLEDTLQRTAPRRFSSGEIGPYGPETSLTRWRIGLTVGADVGLRINQHLEIVPEIRLHWIHRDTVESGKDNSSAFLALGSTVIRPAIGGRVWF